MKDDLSILFRYDERKFRKSLENNDIHKTAQNQLIANMILTSHSLEKSLSIDSFEPGHGIDNVRRLSDLLQIYEDKDYDKSDLGYVSTVSVLREVHKVHKGTEFSDEIENILKHSLSEIKKTNSKIGGSDTLSLDSKKGNSEKNFAELSAGRFSVRTFANKPVKKSDIEDVIRISMKTPTVCNRQPVRVRAMYDRNIINDVLNVQSGLLGYPVPPCLLLITTDDSSYLSINERNQGFIDGGSFAMSVLYALEYKNLAACPLNCMFYEHGEKAVRGMLGIPENEKLITFIACGYFKDKNNICKSFRYPVEYALSEVNTIHKFDIVLEEAHPDNLVLQSQNAELELLRKPGIKLATRKFLGAIRRKIHSLMRIRGTRLLRRDSKIRVRLRKLQAIMRNKNIDGAIITLCDDFNYGNVMQRYALQKFLRDNGSEFIHLSFYTHYLQSIREKHLKNSLSPFVKKRINDSKFNVIDSVGYRNYIVGSDQVWRNHGTNDIEHDFMPYWLNFLGRIRSNNIAYAASFGVDSLSAALIDNNIVEKVRPFLQKFRAISVRENSGVKLVDEIAGKKINSKVVLDPTLLLRQKDYSDLIDNSEAKSSKTPGVFSYILDTNSHKRKIVKKVAESYDLDHGIITVDPSKKLLPMEEWLKGYRDAKFVVTDSFHGTVFSIINEVDFIVLANRERGLARIESLLDLVGISRERLIFSEDTQSLSCSDLVPIDWVKVGQKLEKLRRDSGEWLLDSIEGIKNG